MSEENSAPERPGWHSASAESAAARWAQKHPDEDVDHPPPSNVPAQEEGPDRHSASADAAALRWRQQHPEEEGRGRSQGDGAEPAAHHPEPTMNAHG